MINWLMQLFRNHSLENILKDFHMVHGKLEGFITQQKDHIENKTSQIDELKSDIEDHTTQMYKASNSLELIRRIIGA